MSLWMAKSAMTYSLPHRPYTTWHLITQQILIHWTPFGEIRTRPLVAKVITVSSMSWMLMNWLLEWLRRLGWNRQRHSAEVSLMPTLLRILPHRFAAKLTITTFLMLLGPLVFWAQPPNTPMPMLRMSNGPIQMTMATGSKEPSRLELPSLILPLKKMKNLHFLLDINSPQVLPLHFCSFNET